MMNRKLQNLVPANNYFWLYSSHFLMKTNQNTNEHHITSKIRNNPPKSMLVHQTLLKESGFKNKHTTKKSLF